MARSLTVFAGISLLAAIPCAAAIITVDPNGLGDYTTIQAAINDANDGDIVLVADGIYTGASNRDIDFLGKAITVKSANGPESCIIDCQNSGRGFYFHSDEWTNSVVDGFTITNGSASGSSGGGISCDQAMPTIVNCVISSCKGVGIYCYDDCGGFCWGSGPKIKNCVISDNSGSGIRCNQSSPLIRNCIINGNTATDGGGIYCYGYYWSGVSQPLISNCVIAGNTATRGGGIFCGYDSSALLYNSIVWDNTATYGDQVCLCGYDDGEEWYSSAISVEYTDLQGGPGGVYIACWPANVYWESGNIDVNPNFADQYEYLDPNNTPDDPNDDFWVVLEDYHLKSQVGRWNPFTQTWVQDEVSSPCIDAGMPWTIYDPNSDYRQELWPHGKRINMGAYGNTPEASRSCTNIDDVRLMGADWLQADSVTDIIPYPYGDGIVDLRDYAFLAEHWLCQEQ